MNKLAINLIAIVLLAACSGGCAKDKNVLFIVVDDLNTTLGCYGHQVVKTPNIDALAKSGVLFNNAYCNFAVCSPSRVSLLTGIRPTSINILDNRSPLQNVLGDRVTLPALFKQNGFHTISIGKIFHSNKDGYGDNKAWDEIYNFQTTELGKQGESRNITGGELKWCHWQAAEGTDEDQIDGQVAKKAVEYIKEKHDKPFFLAVGLFKPHDPFIAPKKYFDMYPLEICNPIELPQDWKTPYKHSFPFQRDAFNNFTDRDKREFLRSYYACTSFMDAQVGKLIKALEETGQLDNTLIVFFSDHGYHLGEHNWWSKDNVYQKGTNAPFIVSGHSVGKKGIKSDAMFEFIDIFPTLAEVMNLKNTPDYLEGQSFASVLTDPSKVFRSEVYATTKRGDMFGRMVKNEKWRYIEWDYGKRGRELYDQKIDPIEYYNLAKDPNCTEVVAEMKQLLDKQYKQETSDM